MYLEPHFLTQMVSLEMHNIGNYILFLFWNFFGEDLPKSLAGGAFFWNSALNFVLVFEMRMKTRIFRLL